MGVGGGGELRLVFERKAKEPRIREIVYPFCTQFTFQAVTVKA